MNRIRNLMRCLFPLLCVLLCLLTVSASAESLSLQPELLELKPKAKKELTVKGVRGKVQWTSSDPKIATVKNGMVTGVAAGECEITATVTTAKGKTFTAVSTVRVSIPVTGLKLTASKINMKSGETASLPKITYQPSDATSRELIVTSSDPSIVTVNEDQTLTAVTAGTAIITLTTAQTLGAQIKAEIRVTVSQPVTSIDAPSVLLINPKGTANLNASALPADAANPRLTFESSDQRVAVVNNGGEVKAIGEGSCTVTIHSTDGSGITAQCIVKVLEAVTELQTQTAQQLVMAAGTQRYLAVNAGPASATDRTLDWHTADEAIAYVTDGTLHAVSPGTVKITCTPHDGANLSLMWEVTVEPTVPVQIVSIDRREACAGEADCLFITAGNTSAQRAVEAFDFTVTLQDAQSSVLGVYDCEWTKETGTIAAGGTADSGNWHWSGLSGLTAADRIGITVTRVSFGNHLCETIPDDLRVTQWFE